jgi:hypothetical protein
VATEGMIVKPEFSILNFRCKLPREVAAVVHTLGNSPMRPSSHGFDLFGPVPIIEAARRQAERFLTQESYRNAAISLMDVVLAANRDYNKQVEPHVTRMRRTWPQLTLAELKNMIAARDYIQFKDVWGHKDQKKYELLRQLVDAALELPTQHDWSDYDRLHAWAGRASVARRLADPLGKIRNVGIATFQHLRIVFGIDTVKPDQRVREVLATEFGAPLSPVLAILAVEQIAGFAGMKVIEVDQVFVKYGSGHYVKTSHTSQ